MYRASLLLVSAARHCVFRVRLTESATDRFLVRMPQGKPEKKGGKAAIGFV